MESGLFTLSFSGFILLVLTFFVAGIIDAAAGGGGLLTLPVFEYSRWLYLHLSIFGSYSSSSFSYVPLSP